MIDKLWLLFKKGGALLGAGQARYQCRVALFLYLSFEVSVLLLRQTSITMNIYAVTLIILVLIYQTFMVPLLPALGHLRQIVSCILLIVRPFENV